MQHPVKAPVSSLRIYLRLLRYLQPFLGLFAISLLGFIIFASAQPMQASILKFFVDGLTEPGTSTFHDIPALGELDLAYGVPLLLMAIVFWQGVGSYLGNYFLSRVSLGLIHDLRIALFESLLRLPNTYFDQNSSGHLISRITYNVTMVTGAATDAIKVIISVASTATMVFFIVFLLISNVQSALRI